ncbi:unnamed protein product [Acanthosepion pharaonis]|uniref:Uncharacterized protein n=1 Tax=Acanthosepion pharaonis TaxID=158019 RepID=A0A812B134_ACAPH|nr:unnamed protein product [Sepia pharaonis]
MIVRIFNKPLISFFFQYILIHLTLYKGQMQTQVTGDWTTSIPENLLAENNQTWRLVKCIYDSEDVASTETRVFGDDYTMAKKRQWNQMNASEFKKVDEAKLEKPSKYKYGNRRPTLVEALTNGDKLPMRIFWALFSQLSAISDFPDEETLNKIRKCSPSGTIYDSHVILCPFCRVRTKLPLGHIPPYIDEVICEQTNVACFQKQGKCFQRYMKITALRNIHGSHCLLADQNGHQFWTGNWEIYDQKVRVSCECLLDKRSRFLKYALSYK